MTEEETKKNAFLNEVIPKVQKTLAHPRSADAELLTRGLWNECLRNDLPLLRDNGCFEFVCFVAADYFDQLYENELEDQSPRNVNHMHLIQRVGELAAAMWFHEFNDGLRG
jgi:hypothetical protein